MPVGVEGKSGAVMTQQTGERFDVHAVLERKRCECVPLWHNKDKSENPVFSTGWRFALILFPLKTPSKWGSGKEVEKQGCTLGTNFCNLFRWRKRSPTNIGQVLKWGNFKWGKKSTTNQICKGEIFADQVNYRFSSQVKPQKFPSYQRQQGILWSGRSRCVGLVRRYLWVLVLCV